MVNNPLSFVSSNDAITEAQEPLPIYILRTDQTRVSIEISETGQIKTWNGQPYYADTTHVKDLEEGDVLRHQESGQMARVAHVRAGDLHGDHINVSYEGCLRGDDDEFCPWLPHWFSFSDFIRKFEYHPQFVMPEDCR